MDFNGDDVTLRVNEVELGTWSSVLFDEAEESRFIIHAGANELVFEPDDYIAFGSEVEGRTFRSKLVQEPATPASLEPAAENHTTAVATATGLAGASEATPAPISVTIDQTSIAKSAGLAAVLSAIWPGLGQIYNGEIGKGVATMVIQMINFILLFVLIGFLTGFIVWVWAIYDAYTVAERRLIASST